ncbi:serine/threonine-protein kinase pim-2-like [Pimephales promelas]|nr:serine/threonine-protein kinase pim-2-like [Pimephales promelas]
MVHRIGGRGGRSRPRRTAFSQTAGQEVCRPASDDRGQAHGKKAGQSGSQQRPDDGRPSSTPSKRSGRDKPRECRERKGIGCFLNRVWKATKRYFHCCCLSCAVDDVEPFVPPPDLEPKPVPEPSSPAPDHSGVKPNNGRSGSLRTASTDSSVGITSSSSLSLSKDIVERRFCGEWLSLSSRGSYVVEWRWSGFLDSRSQQSSKCSLSGSESLEGFLYPPLPGQIPVEPTETETNGRTAQGAMEDSPVKKSSTESFECLYNMGQMIGSGGFGRVFNATRRFDGKKVAIKRMRKVDNDRYLNIPGHPEPLVTEVALLLMMRREPISPFVIQLYDWFEDPKTFTLVMEYPDPCESLLDFITRNPRVYEPAARVIMQQAVLAVQHCIEHGVFHNDIHAENFLIKKHSLGLKLIDFGCGQLFSSDGYESKIYIGIQDHCPPEVLAEPRFHAVSANVWSLGVLLYKMTNACRPFCNRAEISQAKFTFQNSNLSKDAN